MDSLTNLSSLYSLIMTFSSFLDSSTVSGFSFINLLSINILQVYGVVRVNQTFRRRNRKTFRISCIQCVTNLCFKRIFDREYLLMSFLIIEAKEKNWVIHTLDFYFSVNKKSCPFFWARFWGTYEMTWNTSTFVGEILVPFFPIRLNVHAGPYFD